MIEVNITFMDDTTLRVQAYRVKVEDGVLRMRTSHETAYTDSWTSVPLVNIKHWSKQ